MRPPNGCVSAPRPAVPAVGRGAPFCGAQCEPFWTIRPQIFAIGKSAEPFRRLWITAADWENIDQPASVAYASIPPRVLHRLVVHVLQHFDLRFNSAISGSSFSTAVFCLLNVCCRPSMSFLTSARTTRSIGYDEAHHLSSFRPARIGNRLNIGLRELHPLLSTEQRQQHQHPLVRSRHRARAAPRMGPAGSAPDHPAVALAAGAARSARCARAYAGHR